MLFAGVLGALALIFVVLLDTFETMILPRRIRHDYRLARLFYRLAWIVWRKAARLLPAGRWRQGFLGVFGPLSLFALVQIWAASLIAGFAILHWSLGTPISGPSESLFTYLYFSGTTFFTLGYGDVVPTGALGRALSVIEAGMGFGFLATVIGYLPVLYQAFSRREITISLFDARAGSPPSASELLRRLADGHSFDSIGPLLVEWERWSAELLESHLSFPVLSYYRSQHDNQSWIGALTAILDTSAFLVAGVDGPEAYQARLTFAMARHAAVDLGLVFRTPPRPPPLDRFSEADFDQLSKSLRATGLKMPDGPVVQKTLTKLRGLYEPFVNALAARFLQSLPSFRPANPPVDNWRTSAWMPRSPGLEALPTAGTGDEHFDG